MSAFNDKAVGNPIDIEQLPVPPLVETLDYEAILTEMLEDLVAKNPAYTSIVESDPAYTVLEVCAAREVVLRQRVNDAARGVMLAYAVGGDLDNLSALLGVARLDGEADDVLRLRTQLAVEGYTTAGSVGSYTFHGLSASPEVKDIDVASPSPGEVVITVLSTVGNGTPDQALLNIVDAALNDECVRPLTDHVTVQAPAVIAYTVEATLWMFEGPDAETVRALAEAQLFAYLEAQHKLGHDIAESGLHQALHISGAVQRVELTSPVATISVGPAEVATHTAVSVMIGGTDE